MDPYQNPYNPVEPTRPPEPPAAPPAPNVPTPASFSPQPPGPPQPAANPYRPNPTPPSPPATPQPPSMPPPPVPGFRRHQAGQVVVGGPAQPMTGLPSMGSEATFGSMPPPPKRSIKPALIALAVLLVVAGSAAITYAAVIVPNKPANVLKTALVNTLQQKQVGYNGKLDLDSASAGGGLSAKVTFSGATDTAKKANDTTVNLTISGVDISVEARLVDGNLYLKPGDLSTITGLVGSFSPDLAKTTQVLSSELSNKWIVVDSTLLKEGGANCALDANWSLTKADIKLLENQYGKHPFAKIQSASNDTVNGKKAEKIVLSLDDDKMAAYTKGLNQLSLVKSLQACQKGTSATDTSNSLADHDHTPLTLWVDKSSKRIVQVASQSTAQDAKKSDFKGSATVTLDYKPVSITAPAGAKPALQVLTDLQNSLGGSSDSSSLFDLFNSGTQAGTDSSTLFQ